MEIRAGSIAVLLVSVQSVLALGVVHLYVSPKGSDTNNGKSLATAFHTIHKAVSLLTKSEYKGVSVFIELAQGYHDLATPIYILHPVTSQITIRSLHGQEVHVTGGKRIYSSHFKPVTDHVILAKLPSAARHHVKVLHLPDVGITSYPPMASYGAYVSRRIAPIEVFQNGVPLRLARWPNEEFINIVNLPDGMNGTKFQYNSSVNRPLSWQHEADLWTYGYWYNSWADRSVKVVNLNAHTHTVTLDRTPPFGMRPGHWTGRNRETGWGSQGGYFRFLNVMSELDEPGEYYLDKSSGNMYVWMPSGNGNVDPTDIIYLSLIDDCFRIQTGTKNVVLRDFTIEACRGSGVSTTNSVNVQILDMEIKNTGGYNIGFTGTNSKCLVARSMLHHGDGGVTITGGHINTLIPSGNIIEDNEIYEYAREGAVGYHGVAVYGVGNTVRYNHIHDGQYTGINFHGNDNIMEHNHVHHVCMNASDCGSFQTGRSWTERGNLIQKNIVHHIRRLVPGADVRGVMLDDQASGTTITNNVFYKNDVHVNIGGGRDNVVNDNVMYDADSYSMQFDGRGTSHSHDKDLYRKLRAVPFNSSLYTSHYPALLNLLSNHPEQPKGNQLHRNLIYNKPGIVFGGRLKGWIDKDMFFNVTDNGYAIGSTDFIDIGHYDFRPQCHAGEWAKRSKFPNVPTVNDVGPRYGIGPHYKRKARSTVTLAKPSNVCPTKAQALTAPMSAYLPDGSRPNDLLHVSKHGCFLSVTKCTAHPKHGLYEDNYGEAHQHTGTNETACLARAAQVWKDCGSHNSDEVRAVYGPTGAMTVAGAGCYMAMYGCPKQSGPADGHVVPGKILRDTYAETHQNASHDQEACLSRALTEWRWCGSNPNHPVTSLYRPTGTSRTAGAGCWISIPKCPRHPTTKSMFYDSWGSTNLNTDYSEDSCFNRASDFWLYCGSSHSYPVTAYYRPKAESHTYPTTN